MTLFQDRISLLIVEDHVALAQNLLEFFDDHRYVLDFASDGLTAIHLLATNSYDVIVLDVMLPGVSGFEVCRRLRQDMACTTPVIMMTAKDQIQDKTTGFLQGADDYLVKPFDLRELKLRVDALHKRQSGVKASLLRAPGLSFDPGTLEVHLDDRGTIELSGIAARIFEELIKAYPDFLSYEHLQDKVWGEREVDMNTLRTHVYALRKHLQDNFGIPMIKTLHGRGYRLMPPHSFDR
ncbi:response regulator transcription factor [Candidimonas sp. SYP-B2681]|uniref:response regulator transcription factor n=1 Tax=Candidimonas sp. SYP-B2681 TaxID=2497686 RepID=UPI000F88B5E3|nr:response regulator transcription factor [Candidimonas sp. SYP-B2681]RTZ45570.1 response regulator transcription factor [Candidimonas sp. SYP-B2681]